MSALFALDGRQALVSGCGSATGIGYATARLLGLLVGVELGEPGHARAVVDAMRRDGVLIGRTGPRGDVLKIRPPLVFAEPHVDLLAAALERALRETESR